MGVTITVTAITVVISILVAAVIVVVTAACIVALVDLVRTPPMLSPLEQVEADYRAASHAMNDAAGQSWRNLID